MIKKILAMIGWFVLAIVMAVVISGTMYLALSPQFGGKASKAQKAVYAQSGLFKEGRFWNTLETKMDIEYGKLMRDYIKKDSLRSPSKPIEVVPQDSADIANWDLSNDQLFWFGHSSFLVQIDGKKILLDPMFSASPSPVPFMGAKRYSKSLPILPDQLPTIDAVILSHDHYDHLDFKTIKAIKDKVAAFYVPMGVENHLLDWGVDSAKINVLKWWDEIYLDSIKLVFTPARHFSGRGVFDRNTTLWGSWAIKGKSNSLFFSGDGGYGSHFKEIGEKLGSFDLALMECGQYNKQWQAIHMLPEESVQAAKDINANTVMPIHWGAFTLALHSWTDPVERTIDEAKRLEVSVITPQIGELVILDSITASTVNWWKEYVD